MSHLKMSVDNPIDFPIGTVLTFEVTGREGNQLILEVKKSPLTSVEDKQKKVAQFKRMFRQIAENGIDLSDYTPIKREKIYKDV
jgi:hypothetical protein